MNERRRDELGALGHAINQMASRLAGLVGGQKRFLGDVAHELCSPLAKLRVRWASWSSGRGEGERGYVSQADEEAGRMADLVNELLSFSKTALGVAQVKLRPVAVAEALQDAARREETEGVTIVVEAEPGLRAMAEPQLLTRAVANLLRNAAAYAGAAGPIRVTAAPEGGKGAGGGVGRRAGGAGRGVGADFRSILPAGRVAGPGDGRGWDWGWRLSRRAWRRAGGTVSCRNRTPSGLEVTILLAAAGRE